MNSAFSQEMADVTLGLAQCPAARATPAELAARLGRPLGVVSRALREAERCRLVGSSITLSAQPGRDRVFWLTAETGTALPSPTNRAGTPPNA